MTSELSPRWILNYYELESIHHSILNYQHPFLHQTKGHIDGLARAMLSEPYRISELTCRKLTPIHLSLNTSLSCLKENLVYASNHRPTKPYSKNSLTMGRKLIKLVKQ